MRPVNELGVIVAFAQKCEECGWTFLVICGVWYDEESDSLSMWR